jgi:hypothetical protein
MNGMAVISNQRVRDVCVYAYINLVAVRFACVRPSFTVTTSDKHE